MNLSGSRALILDFYWIYEPVPPRRSTGWVGEFVSYSLAFLNKLTYKKTFSLKIFITSRIEIELDVSDLITHVLSIWISEWKSSERRSWQMRGLHSLEGTVSCWENDLTLEDGQTHFIFISVHSWSQFEALSVGLLTAQSATDLEHQTLQGLESCTFLICTCSEMNKMILPVYRRINM